MSLKYSCNPAIREEAGPRGLKVGEDRHRVHQTFSESHMAPRLRWCGKDKRSTQLCFQYFCSESACSVALTNSPTINAGRFYLTEGRGSLAHTAAAASNDVQSLGEARGRPAVEAASSTRDRSGHESLRKERHSSAADLPAFENTFWSKLCYCCGGRIYSREIPRRVPILR